ncbi:DUF1697 domain-containing protein [Aquipuribacter sp. MA13-6]|uniref:DUF1697 domain-containing protein n=1 Tax=unclassified Aquipuribacter TaxID=2635084 RepID=UPI003EE9CABE
MTRIALLPRGINLGARNKVSMPALREAMTAAGFTGVQTYLASGNVVVERGGEAPQEVADRFRALVADRFGVDTPCLTRLRDEVDATVDADPLGTFPGVAADPSRHSVTFCSAPPDPDAVAALDAAAYLPERFAVVDRDIHLWHPDGTRNARLPQAVSRLVTGVVSARSWRTVLALQRMLTPR